MRAFGLLVILLALLGSPPSHGGELSAVEIKSARKLYLGKCAKCHKLYNPSNYAPQQWDEWMTKMNSKSKLKPEQAELLARYIIAARNGKVELPQR